MVRSVSRSAVALAAALSLSASPAFAAKIYVPVILDHSGAVASAPVGADTANQSRSWGGWGGRRHRDDVSVGDVLTGVLIIGGIAAIASAASKGSRDRQQQDTYRYPAPESRSDSGRYGEPVPQRSWGSERNIDRAVDACVAEVERGERRVETVDSVGRNGDGWRVSGQVSGGRGFNCSVDRDGRVRTVDGIDRADNGYDGTGEDDRPEYPG